MPYPRHTLFHILTAFAFSLLAVVPAAAQTAAWTGGLGGGTDRAASINGATAVTTPGSSTAGGTGTVSFAGLDTSDPIRFDFSTLGSPYNLGTLQLPTASPARTFGSSGVAGTLVLNGTGANNLILDNASANLLTISPVVAGGTGNLALQIVQASSEINAAGPITIGAAITGTGGLNKLGAAVVTFSGANTYSGITTVGAGTLALVNSGSFASSPTVTVGPTAFLDVSGVTGGANHDGTQFALVNGQTLRGTGTVTGNAGVPAGAAVAPGTPGNIGILTVAGATEFATGMLSAKLGASGSSDLLSATGVVNLLTGSTVQLVSTGFVPGSPATYTLATGSSVQVNGGTPANPISTFTVGGGSVGPVNLSTVNFGNSLTTGDVFTLRQSGTGLVVDFTPVPEPGTVIGLAAAGLWVGRRLRRRTAA